MTRNPSSQLPVVREDIPGPAVTNYLGAVRSLETVDLRATMVGHGFRLPCSDSDESDDDVLSVGPVRPLVTAALLGGAGGHDDDMLQVNSLSGGSVYSWTAEDPYGTCCAQLDNFNWVIQAGDMVGELPEPELEVDSSDIESNVYDVYNDVPDEFPVEMEATAVELLCSPVVIQTRPQGDCDSVLPLRMCQGQDFPTQDGPEVVVSGRESILTDSDVRGDICVMLDQLPVVLPKSAAVPLAVSVVAQTRPRGGGGSNLLLPVDMSIEPLDYDDDGPDVIISGRESTVMISGVSPDISVQPNQRPIMVSKEDLPVFALTRSQVGCTPVIAWPAHDDMISQVEVDQDMLSGRIMKSVDPDEESGDLVSLMAVPVVDCDACHTEWRETVVDDMVMEKFVLVPELCPIVSMTSAAEPTFWPALSEVYSPV